jgi:hypothetical protein
MAMSHEVVGRTVCREFDAFVADDPSTARWNVLRQRLSNWFATVDEATGFAGMLWIIENSERFQHHELAGELLCGRQMPLPIPLSEFIWRIAPKLNPSAMAIPQYIRDRVGRGAAMREVTSQLSSATDERTKIGLSTLSYWLSETGEG